MGFFNSEERAARKERARLRQQQYDAYINSEEYKRKVMYEDVHTIKKWFVFWSWLTVIGLIIYIMSAFFAALTSVPS